MRIVAKFQFVSAGMTGVDGNVANVIEKWKSKKFEQDSNGMTVIRTSGLPAQFDRREAKLADAAQTTFHVLEPVPGGQLETQVRILETGTGIRFQCSLALGSDAGLQSPRVDIRSPRFIREIIDLGLGWRIGDDGERIFSKCFDVEKEDIHAFEGLISAPQRRLPVIVVSELHGETLAGDIHERISHDTCGLAHTCRLTEEASWELTEKLGKNWSCYNGAVRLFWPFKMNRDDFRAHPLWTYDHLMRRADNEIIARDRFRHELATRLIEASTFVADDTAFVRFEAEQIRQASDKSRAIVSESGDFKALADLYATENDSLKNALDAKSRENETLQQNIEALTIALRAGSNATAHQSLEDAPPISVADAVAVAQKTLPKSLVFSSDLADGIATLNPTAGPPDKILRYFEVLAELSNTLNGGRALGRSLPIWLQDKGVTCSRESETVRGNKTALARRTFKIGDEELYCEYHAKPSDNVPPDLCVRIYFAVTDQFPCIRIGYVGRHFD
jgi:hypothetical protein